MTEEKDQGVKKIPEDDPVELESQFVLRLPPTPAAALRAAVRSGVMNLKDRLMIQIDTDMRHGAVRYDKWNLSARVVDLPTILESHKTLDRKNFYKTADICQLMVCKEEDDLQKTDDEESPKKKDKKDAKDKKYIQPHGITLPLKNVRKRRFRKTLKKKYIDFPEIEKEVKRLFRMDNEAISVRYEVVNADEEKGEEKAGGGDFSNEDNMMSAGGPRSNSQSLDVAEYDIFGEVLSSSENEGDVADLIEDETSQMSTGTSRRNTPCGNVNSQLVTEFSKSMLDSPLQSEHSRDQEYCAENDSAAVFQLESATAGENLGQILKEQKTEEEKTVLLEKLDELEHEIAKLQARRRAQELEIISIENQALKQRFQSIIENLKQQEYEKQKEYDDIVTVLHQA